ncbi:hypothetical protein PIB30_017252 [Stylosanthes scabra]|uniref:Bet v I/Major latex protein domain-containing protein n=1 Tax=Stylosanthes scabra TaxID=79078 RepID=A0ABU6Q840_9FABA|nr:hypothetical protein [Stylosanthes scabra]
MDEEEKSLSYKNYDSGQNYKVFNMSVQVTETNNECALVKWTIEYEKINEDANTPWPYSYLEFSGRVCTKLKKARPSFEKLLLRVLKSTLGSQKLGAKVPWLFELPNAKKWLLFFRAGTLDRKALPNPP